MKNIIWIILALLFLSTSIAAQDTKTDEQNKKEVSKLAFIVGDWKGDGWMMGRDRQQHAFTQTETIRFKLDSTAILIEGRGMNNGEIIHNALAVITYDKEKGHFNFHSFLANGREGTFKAELLDHKLYWYPMENMRYVISRNDKGQWYEIGEMNRGGQWFQFFEMTLDKQ